MELQTIYNEYLNIKFKRGLPPVRTNPFEYGLYEDDSADLFLTDHPDETFTNWMYDLQPRDPHYVSEPNWQPVLADVFQQMDIYDEQVLYHLLFTINTTLSIHSYNAYSAMNEWMKSYSFLQLSHLSEITRLNEEQKHQLRDFFFFFYLYAHPVNEETLYACSFKGQNLVHTKTDISLEHYFTAFHDHYSTNMNEYSQQITIAPHDIPACKHLTLELLRCIEGKSAKLNMPEEEGLEALLPLINDVDQMLQLHDKNKPALFDIMKNFLTDARSTPYRDHCFTMLLQNYAAYILFFRFDEIYALVDYFEDTPVWCRTIINKIFMDTIFMERILRQKRIDITAYPNVTQFFEDEAKRIYL
ncbi:hypothetical protein ACINKY_23840 [Paenibacillus illinoisensis]|uniref:Uncharacterized protein n=1 Tax=Paenibacillus illinoisensis TaxID=59845 RepID=A0ABW8I0J9_9BACL